jgi:5-methylcytosine-specific restriction protein B
LSRHDREFGHRTYHEAIRFARRFSEIDSNTTVALDLQVLQKVLPRLHGSRRELTEVLNDLGRWCFHGSDSEASQTFDTAATEPSGAKLPASYEKLHRMAKRLRDRHFVSFAE